jgi:hypothetical protein
MYVDNAVSSAVVITGNPASTIFECTVCNRGYQIVTATDPTIPSIVLGFQQELLVHSIESGNLCGPCQDHCEECDAGICYDCANNYYLTADGMECVASCPSDYYRDDVTNSQTGICSSCHSSCNQCTGPTEFDCT